MPHPEGEPRISPLAPLAPIHDVGAFRCGDPDIDRFLHMQATAEQALRLSQIYVSTEESQRVVAYFTLSPITVRLEPALVERLAVGAVPYPAVGGFLLGRLGVDLRLQGRGVGESLVLRAAQIAKRESAIVGGAFLAVDPKTDRLVAWYERQEFVRLGGRTRRMVLPLRSVP